MLVCVQIVFEKHVILKKLIYQLNFQEILLVTTNMNIKKNKFLNKRI